MNRFVLVLFLFLPPIFSHSQEAPLFKIIAVHGTVLLDGDSVYVGQSITSVSKRVQIKGFQSYVSVLTEKGYVFRLGVGNRSVKLISKMKKSNLFSINHEAGGAVHRGGYYDISIMGVNRPQYAEIAQDSLTIVWKATQKEDSLYRIRLTSVFEDLLADTITRHPSTTLKISQFLAKDAAILFDVSSESRGRKYSSKQIVV